jgi:hypothetical protein
MSWSLLHFAPKGAFKISRRENYKHLAPNGA